MITTLITKDCLLFATADWDTPYWTNKQHTAHHLALMGYRVLYIESLGLRAPTANAKDLKRIWQRLKSGLRPPKQVKANVWVLSPIAIPFKHHWALIRIINQGCLRLCIKLFMQQHEFRKPMIWTYHPFMQSSIKDIENGPLVYHCVDDLSAMPGIDAEKFNAEEQRLLPKCNAVFVTSQTLKVKCQPFHAEIYYFPNVVDIDHFGLARQEGALPADIASIPSPRIGFMGSLSDFKVDFELIHSVAICRPQWNFVLIGDAKEESNCPWVAKLRTHSNVHFLGHKTYNQLPSYLRGIDVGILPTLINDYTKSMFPMKYFEYLAAGVPVASTPLDFTRQHGAGLKVAGSTEGFIAAINEQLQRGKLTSEEAVAFVGENTWSARLKKMLAIVETSQ